MGDRNLYLSALFGGASAGFTVDVSLFPLDTLKTRLQSPQGFKQAGGFKNIYRGIGPQVIGSVPQAALFFCTYEWFKNYATPLVPQHAVPLVHMAGASIAEVVACLVRVPMEVVKQRRQTVILKDSSWRIAVHAYSSEGIGGLYRGFGSMVIREIPFSFIQFPIYEYLKQLYKADLRDDMELKPWEVANCGAIAGAISAAATTPLDVVKTRIMLTKRSEDINNLKYTNVARVIYETQGVKGFLAGFVPRVLWITIGGYIFFGMYDASKNYCNNHLIHRKGPVI